MCFFFLSFNFGHFSIKSFLNPFFFHFPSCFLLLSLISLFKVLSLQQCLPLTLPWLARLRILCRADMSQWSPLTKRSTMKQAILFCQRHAARQFTSSAWTGLITPTRRWPSSLAISLVTSIRSAKLAITTARILLSPWVSVGFTKSTERWACSPELLEISLLPLLSQYLRR